MQGNPRQNAMYICQLQRVQLAVNALYDEEASTDKNWPFWVDTLCVPLDAGTRSTAIARMAKTYFHAEKVLVLDGWLNSTSRDAEPRELLVKIAVSDWNTRLWTFHEAKLAQQCHFQFGDRALSVDELKDTAKVTENLQELSDILSGMDRNELIASPSAVNLLRGLTSVEPRALNNVQYYASLPVQSDPEIEELRLQALEQQEKVTRAWQLFELWSPVVAQTRLAAAEYDLDSHLRAHVETRIHDPILAYGFDALYRFRGYRNWERGSRAADIAGGAHRQLQGLDSSPAELLRDASRGLPGRMTSRLEDETICLGGILGLDVTPLLEIFVEESERNEERVQEVCLARMKRFLATVRYLPSSVLFWETERMPDHPWRWASRSFLDSRACAAMFNTDMAECTPDGLVASYRGIRVQLSRSSAIERRFRTLRLRYIDPDTQSGLGQERLTDYLESWMQIELRESTESYAGHRAHATWWDYFHGEAKEPELAIVTFAQQRLHGALVAILRTEEGVIHAKYLANVARVSGDSEPEYLESYVDAVWMGWRRWCIG